MTNRDPIPPIRARRERDRIIASAAPRRPAEPDPGRLLVPGAERPRWFPAHLRRAIAPGLGLAIAVTAIAVVVIGLWPQ